MATFPMALFIQIVSHPYKTNGCSGFRTTLFMDWFFVVWLSIPFFCTDSLTWNDLPLEIFLQCSFWAKCPYGGVLGFIQIYMCFLSYNNHLNMVEWRSLEVGFTSTATPIRFYYHHYHIMHETVTIHILASFIHGGVNLIEIYSYINLHLNFLFHLVFTHSRHRYKSIPNLTWHLCLKLCLVQQCLALYIFNIFSKWHGLSNVGFS